MNPGFLPAGSISVGATAFRINRGRDFFVAGRYFTGMMDEIALYDRVLDTSEVHGHAIAAPEPARGWLIAAGALALGALAHWGHRR